VIIQCEHLHVELKHGSTFELASACGNKLTCVAGTIWITQHHLSNDWVLRPGECLTIENPGKVVISTCHESAQFSAQQRANEHVRDGLNQTRNARNGAPSRTERVEA
jgi:hypothetical protein